MALSKLIILLLGVAYPAYYTFKVLKSKNSRLYGKWMKYWIAFACFTCAESFADVLFSWFSFYYWIKIIFLLWLLSPRGSSILYGNFIHPLLKRKENDIDNYILKIQGSVFPFVNSSPSTSSLDSCDKWENSHENNLPVRKNRIGEVCKEEGFNRLLEAAKFWTSTEEVSEDLDPIEIELKVKYKSGTTKMLIKQITEEVDNVQNKTFMYIK